ncbi:hypothetical protein [Pseudomonas coronafaciens]|uniref:hypothetical protein n=1 Tax=Pseudomonas coronafaciens TaxID=53409 RepID=UPI000AC5696F|nr:hypothetical protein [Pseudomonas coronafaciens]
MKEHTSHIKNPLTVISRFAAVAEICGSVVLPLIEPDNQSMYIWFLILFPTFIVTLFFATLNFNHKTLYVPSDYKNEDHFISLFGKVTTAERNEKLQEEVDEAIPGPEQIESDLDLCETGTGFPPPYDQGPASEARDDGETPDRLPNSDSVVSETANELTQAPSNDPSKTPQSEENQLEENKFDFEAFAKDNKEQIATKIKKIDALAIHKLSFETNKTFLPEVKFDIPGLISPLIFDAIASTDEAVHIAEVKYFKSIYTNRRFAETFKKANFAARNIKRVSDKKIYLHIIIVLDESAGSFNAFNIKRDIQELCDKYEFSPLVHISTLDDLMDINKPLDSWLFTLTVK